MSTSSMSTMWKWKDALPSHRCAELDKCACDKCGNKDKKSKNFFKGPYVTGQMTSYLQGDVLQSISLDSDWLLYCGRLKVKRKRGLCFVYI